MGLKVSKSSSTKNYDPITQRSNFVLELVHNADENAYASDVEPTLTFILQELGVTILNNDVGFSVESIKALCDDVFKSKGKKLSGDRSLDQNGIGFKSVFCVTDAPEIHYNEFNIKFNKSDGLPTVVPPCDVNKFRNLVDADTDPMDEERWNTCILLPTKNEESTHTFLMWIFSRLYPHALLFLHRLECIKYINLVRGVNLVMRKEVVGDGIVNISNGYGKMTWFVKSSKLPADQIRHDVQTTEISMAFLLDDLDNGNYMAKLSRQQAFAYIRPLSMYGLNFIIQADFIVSSVGEEVDVDSPWNQWLLSEFPNLFVSAERSFCRLPCFKENQAKGVSNFMSFFPLGGEVHGFFSSLPHMIISKLRVSNCLLLEGDDDGWARPCEVVRNWREQIRSLLPDNLIREHLDVRYLSKYTVIKDSLAQALGIEDCGPKFLVRAMTYLCRAGSLKSMGLIWLSSWLDILFQVLVNETKYDVISSLSHLLFIPLIDGNYASISEGAIWLLTGEDDFEMFGKLYRSLKLRIVDPDLFSDHVENITQMLYKFGVQRLSAHEVIKAHILPAICDENFMAEHIDVMIECLSFIMFHLESSCPDCLVEKEHILSQLSNNAYISANHGYKRLVDVPIHSIEGKIQLLSTNKQKLLKLRSEESERSMNVIPSLEEGKLTPNIEYCFVANVISPPSSTSKNFQRKSRRKTAQCLEDASKTNEVNSKQMKHDETLKGQSGSGKRWVKKVKEFGLASDFVSEGEGNGAPEIQVTDAPEIHSNGFHIKFDISDGPIGFFLPTVVPPYCDADLFSKLVSGNNDPTDETCWKTCIVLPFRSKEGEANFQVKNLISMFSSFHPSLLLFLHRLKCIKFRNTLNDSLIVMRKQVVIDGIVNVFLGKEKFNWFVKSTPQACHIRHDVQTPDISVALMLDDFGNGNDIPKLNGQLDFALFPSRSYGLKFIIQADFVVSSSREEVNKRSP